MVFKVLKAQSVRKVGYMSFRQGVCWEYLGLAGNTGEYISGM